MAKKAQTATEYLIILAVVILVAIVVMSVLGVMPSMGGDAGSRAAMAQLQAEKIGVQSYSVTPNGTFVFLRNNHYEMIRIENITINEIPCSNTNPRLPITLDVAQQRTVFCFNVTNSNVGDLYDYSLHITWVEVSSGGRYAINYAPGLTGRVAEIGDIPENPGSIEEEGGNNGVSLFSCDSAESEGAQAGVFYNGSGTFSEPYGICNVTMLQNMSLNLSAHYVLLGDIDATGFDFEPIGYVEGDGYDPFTGIFDGQNFIISNLNIDKTSVSGDNYVGLFAFLGSGGEIVNLGLENIVVSGSWYVGGLVGFQFGGSIFSSYATGNVYGSDSVGGLAGVSGGNIDQTYFSGEVNGTNIVGGLVGNLTNNADLRNSFVIGSVAGVDVVGGLVGIIDGAGSIFRFSFSSALIIGDANVGGAVGSLKSGSIINVYWDFWESLQESSAAGNPLTTDQMMEQASFSSWNFATIWNINEGSSYPWLQNLPNPHN